MAQLSYAQLEGLWMRTAAGTKYGTRGWAALMAAIAEAESAGNASATNPNDNGGRQTSWGLWQISLGNHTPPAANWADPATNAQLALGKLQDQGLGAWGTYDSGAYRAYLSGSTTPDGNIPANPGAAAAEAGAGQASDCLLGFGGVPGTSWIIDLTGSGGNLGQMCIVTRSEARGWIGAGLIVAGSWIFIHGLGLAVVAVGLQTPLGQKAAKVAWTAVTKKPAKGKAKGAPQGGAPAAGP